MFLNEVPLRTPLCPRSLLTDRTLTQTVDYVMVRVCEILAKAADYMRENSEQCNDRLNNAVVVTLLVTFPICFVCCGFLFYDMMYLLTAIGLPPGGSSTVHIYTQTIHRTTQPTQTIHRATQFSNQEECGPCPVFASFTLAFALQLRKKHGKTSVRVAGECQLANSIQNRAYLSI